MQTLIGLATPPGYGGHGHGRGRGWGSRLLAGVLASAVAGGCALVDQLSRATVRLDSGDAVAVTAIRGGDELVVTKNGAEFLVHLQGVQAFDPVLTDAYVQAASDRAKAFLEPWVGRRVHIYLETAGPGPGGRYWAYLQDATRELNLQVVLEGIAPVYTEYPFGHEAAYLEAERHARGESKGIWSDPKTIFVVSGLRRTWRLSRQNRHAPLIPDPLL